MKYKELFQRENENVQERFVLACERIDAFTLETGIQDPFLDYFKKMVDFVEVLLDWKYQIETGMLWTQDV